MASIILWIVQLGSIPVALKVLFEVLSHVLGPSRERQLQTTLHEFELGLRRGASAPLCPGYFRFLASVYRRMFGAAPFWLCAKVSLLLLVISLALGGIFSGVPFCMTQFPWVLFHDLIQTLAEHSAPILHDPRFRDAPLGLAHFQQNLADFIALQGPIAAVLFTIWFVFVVLSATAVSFRVSVGLAGRVLQDLVVERAVFSRFLLLVATVVLVIVLALTEFCMLCLCLNIWMWPFIPVFLIIFRLVPVLGFTLTGGLFLILFLILDVWLLRVVLLISTAPCLAVIFFLAVSVIAAPFKRSLLGSLASFFGLALKSAKGPMPFFAVACSAVILACSFLAWLAQLHYTPIFIRIFGLAVLFLLTLYLLTRFNRSHPAGAVLGFLSASLLFVGTASLVVLGFFLEAILGAYLSKPIEPGSPYEILLCSLAPAGVASFGVVRLYAVRPTYSRAFFPFLFTLLLSDSLFGLAGMSSYRDVLFSFACDFVGAMSGAFALIRGHRYISERWSLVSSVPRRSSSPPG
jgi:hypothetical protein